ncbi:gamma-glutamyltransferase, partial [Pseudomonas aeruginosa]|nr:gamma-glutamyltransferase [Pseudomonas aeruginosa]
GYQRAGGDRPLSESQRGHQVEIAYDSTSYGRGQIVLRDPASGVLCGGTEPRTDSQIAVW